MPLTKHDQERIIAEVRGKYKVGSAKREYPRPKRLAKYLKKKLPRWLAGEQKPPPASLPPTAEAVTLAVAAAYGPSEGFPPADVLEAACSAAPFPDEIDTRSVVRAIERAFVHSLLLPALPTRTARQLPCAGDFVGWYHRWPGSYQVLFEWLRRCIFRAVDWLFARVIHCKVGDRNEQVKDEVSSCALQLGRALLVSCDCWRKAENLSLSLETRQTKEGHLQLGALGRCAFEHCLHAWDGQTPLGQFLFWATVHGRLQLSSAKRRRPELAEVNNFRHGMLAKEVAEGSLHAGYVLRCPGMSKEANEERAAADVADDAHDQSSSGDKSLSRSSCAGEIQPGSNRCDVCGRLTEVSQPAFWLWLMGRRGQGACWRCTTCKFLYFTSKDEPCPRQTPTEAHQWSRRPITIWTRLRTDYRDPNTLADTGMQPPDIVILAEGWHRLLDTFKSFPEKEREAAEELIRDPKHLHDIARDLNCDATDPMFLELLRRIIGVCKQVCPVDVEQLFSDNGTHRLASTLLNGNDDLEQVARRLRRNPGSQQFRQEVLRVLLQALDHVRKSLLECATDGEELNLPEEVRP